MSIIKVARTAVVAVALTSCSIASLSPAHHVSATSGRASGGVKAQYYDCLQGDAVPAPVGLAPGSLAPPDLLKQILAEPLHKNGRKCAWFTGGTAKEQRSAALAFQAQQAQGDTTVQTLSCANSGDVYTPVQESAGGDVINVVVHWRLNSDCTHTFYNNQYSFASNPNQLWLQGAQICDSTNSYCTPFVNAGFGCSNIPTSVQFGSTGLGDPDRQWWQTLDQYATTNWNGCYGLANGTATFGVWT